MRDKDYNELYNYIKNSLYDPVYGLNIRYNEDLYGLDMAMEKNRQVLSFIMSSEENEKKIIDRIIDRGILELEDKENISLDNLKKFLNVRTIVPLARGAYERILMEFEEGTVKSK